MDINNWKYLLGVNILGTPWIGFQGDTWIIIIHIWFNSRPNSFRTIDDGKIWNYYVAKEFQCIFNQNIHFADLCIFFIYKLILNFEMRIRQWVTKCPVLSCACCESPNKTILYKLWNFFVSYSKSNAILMLNLH